MNLGPNRFAGALAAAAALAMVASMPVAAASGPFGGLDGRWVGSGTISLSSGTRERIRCKSQNLVQDDDNNLQQALRCASDSYKFEVNTYVDHNDGAISGRWDELTNKVYGNLVGSIRGRRIEALVTATGFTAGFRMDMTATRQSVLITPETEHTDITEVKIDLRKQR